MPHTSSERSFVLQLTSATDVERRRLEGRVEHVASGQATHFRSLDELLTFLARLLGTGERDET